MKKQAKDLKHSNNHVKNGTHENEIEEPDRENKKVAKDRPPIKIIEDDFELDSTPFSAFEDLTGTVKNEG